MAKWTKGELRFAMAELDADNVRERMAKEILEDLITNEASVRINWDDDRLICASCETLGCTCDVEE